VGYAPANNLAAFSPEPKAPSESFPGNPENMNTSIRLGRLHHGYGSSPGFDQFGEAMRDFSGAAFAPELVDVMTRALDASIATLPDPVTSTQVNQLAESILRTAREGERDPAVLQRMALLELQIRPRG
jgi:hypothetical protein